MTPEEERRLRAIMNGEAIEPVDLGTVRLGGIQTIWLFVMRTQDGREGVPAIQVDQLAPIPEFMIATDEQRLSVWKQVAPEVAKQSGCQLTLYRWDGPRVAEQRYDPPPPPPGIDALHS